MNLNRIYGCTVVISSYNIFNFTGNIAEIKEKLKFIYNHIYFIEIIESDEESAETKPIPVILSHENDITDVRVFSLSNYKEELAD